MAYDARQVVEGLRSGVAYREMAKKVVFGREKTLTQVERILESIEQGHKPKSSAYIVRANYGEGKTHVLHSLWGMAEDRNWVVSQVSLSRETPLDRLDQLYSKVMENTYVPGSLQPGIAHIVTAALDEPRVLADLRVLDLAPRVSCLIDNLVSRNEGMPELISDIEGRFLSTAELKQIHRGNIGKPLKLPRSSIREDVYDYLRLVDWLIAKAGFAGWLILFDEVELIGKLGKSARTRSYGHMGRLISGFLPHTASVWAVASNFNSDVLLARGDREEAPRYLASRPKDEALAPFAELATDALLESKMLDPLSRPQVRDLIRQIYEMHEEAYGWQVPFTEEDLYEKIRALTPTQDTRVRTWVRLSLMVLDIWYQYGTAPTVSVMKQLHEYSLEEDPEADAESSGMDNTSNGLTGSRHTIESDATVDSGDTTELSRPMIIRTPSF